MNTFPQPRSLQDVAAACGVDGVHDLALACGAIEIDPKAGQAWRCVLESQVIIGYKTTAVVAGRDELAMDYVAARIRAAAGDDTEDATARYHAYAMALDVRKLSERMARGDLDVLLPAYTELIARLFAVDEVQGHAMARLLATSAPEALRAVQIALAIYERGMIDGLDAAAPDEDDDDYFLPELPDTPPPMVSSA